MIFFFKSISRLFIFIVSLSFSFELLSDSNSSLPQVKVKKAEFVNIKNQIELTGSIRANESIEVTSVISEKIKKINFLEGEYVKEGEILIVFENDQEKAELKQVKAELDEANLNFERAKKLVEEGNASQSMLDKRVMRKKKLEGKYED